MCGRFTLSADNEALAAAFPGVVIPEHLAPRYNIAPTQSVAVIRNMDPKTIELIRWGLIPSWAKDIKIGSSLINARAESLAEKPSFKHSFKKKRCLVIADGFYEWIKEPGGKVKTPMYIRLRSGRPFAFAGLWDTWRLGDDEISSCTIITTSSNDLVARIHDRMPVILSPTIYDVWLDTMEMNPEDLQSLLTPYPSEEMTAYEVSAKVNDAKMDSNECILPVSG